MSGSQIKTKTISLTEISISNSLGEIDASIPFSAFGPAPYIGSYLIFESKEWSNKNVVEITIKIYWSEDSLPVDFATYYSAYTDHHTFRNDSFKVNFLLCLDGKWSLLGERPYSLFQESEQDKTISPVSTFSIQINRILKGNNHVFDQNMPGRDGQIKMELVEPEIAFGHNVFSDIYSESVLSNARGRDGCLSTVFPWLKRNQLKNLLPSAPYTPIVEKFEVTVKGMESNPA